MLEAQLIFSFVVLALVASVSAKMSQEEFRG